MTQNSKNTHEVYMAFDENNCVIYVGSGQRNRHKHCNSGISHCYELNKFHFSGKTMKVELIKANISKEESIALERELIEKHKPLFNKQFVKDGDDRLVKMQQGYAIKLKTLDWIYTSNYPVTRRRIAKKKVEEIFEKYGCLALVAGVKLSPKEIYSILRPDLSVNKTSAYAIIGEIFEVYEKRFLKMREDFINTILNQNTTKEE